MYPPPTYEPRWIGASTRAYSARNRLARSLMSVRTRMPSRAVWSSAMNALMNWRASGDSATLACTTCGLGAMSVAMVGTRKPSSSPMATVPPPDQDGATRSVDDACPLPQPPSFPSGKSYTRARCAYAPAGVPPADIDVFDERGDRMLPAATIRHPPVSG